MLQKEIIFSRLSDKLPPAEEDRSTLLKNVHTMEYIIYRTQTIPLSLWTNHSEFLLFPIS